MSVALCLLGAAIWLSGRGGCAVPQARTLPRRAVNWRLSPATLRWLAAGTILAASVVLFGPIRGGVGGLAVAPIVAWLVGLAQARAVVRAPPDAARRVPLVLDLLAATGASTESDSDPQATAGSAPKRSKPATNRSRSR